MGVTSGSDIQFMPKGMVATVPFTNICNIPMYVEVTYFKVKKDIALAQYSQIAQILVDDVGTTLLQVPFSPINMGSTAKMYLTLKTKVYYVQPGKSVRLKYRKNFKAGTKVNGDDLSSSYLYRRGDGGIFVRIWGTPQQRYTAPTTVDNGYSVYPMVSIAWALTATYKWYTTGSNDPQYYFNVDSKMQSTVKGKVMSEVVEVTEDDTTA